MHNLEKYSLASLDPLDLAPVAPSMACVVAELPNPVAEGRGCCGTRRGGSVFKTQCSWHRRPSSLMSGVRVSSPWRAQGSLAAARPVLRRRGHCARGWEACPGIESIFGVPDTPCAAGGG